MKYSDISKTLIDNIPEFKPIYDKHITENGEVLNHVLFGDFTGFTTAKFNISSKEPIFIRCVDFVEQMLASDDPLVKDLAIASFLENLNKENLQAMKDGLGKKTVEVAKKAGFLRN